MVRVEGGRVRVGFRVAVMVGVRVGARVGVGLGLLFGLVLVLPSPAHSALSFAQYFPLKAIQ